MTTLHFTDTPRIVSLLAETSVEINDDFWQAIIELQFKKLSWDMKRVVMQAIAEENFKGTTASEAIYSYWNNNDSLIYTFTERSGLSDFFPLVEGDDYDEPWDNMIYNVFVFLKGLAKQDIDTVAPIPEDF